MAVKEYLEVVVALAFALAVVVVDADMTEAEELFTPLIALHMQTSI